MSLDANSNKKQQIQPAEIFHSQAGLQSRQGSLYAIGDVHGCLTSLETIFRNIDYSSSDTFVFLGDYIDRGVDSKGVIDFIMALSKKTNVITLLGNHEVMMSQAKDDRLTLSMWLRCGGSQTLDSYNAGDVKQWVDDIPQSHWNFIANLRLYYETDKYIFAHAAVNPNKNMENQDASFLLWQHNHENIKHKSGKTLVVGHTPQVNKAIKILPNTIFVDTLSFDRKDSWLSCINLTEYEKNNESFYYQGNEKGEFRKRGND